MPLEPFPKKKLAQVIEDMNLLTSEIFKLPCDGDNVFHCATKKAKQPWMARQSVSLAVGRILQAMYRPTGKRRWNKDFGGSHVTVHGATRHTASALLLAPPDHGKKVPSEHVIMEIQQRHDIKTFRRHYCHAQDDKITEALEHVSVPVSFHLGATVAPTVSKTETQQQNTDPAPAAATAVPMLKPQWGNCTETSAQVEKCLATTETPRCQEGLERNPKFKLNFSAFPDLKASLECGNNMNAPYSISSTVMEKWMAWAALAPFIFVLFQGHTTQKQKHINKHMQNIVYNRNKILAKTIPKQDYNYTWTHPRILLVLATPCSLLAMWPLQVCWW